MIVLLSVIYFVNYANEICFELWIILKNGKVGFVSKTRQYDSNSGYVRKVET